MTSTTMVAGRWSLTMVQSGIPSASLPIGFLTVSAIGPGSIPGAGIGWKTNLGVSAHFITGAGYSSGQLGVGYLALTLLSRCTRQRWSHLSVDRAFLSVLESGQ